MAMYVGIAVAVLLAVLVIWLIVRMIRAPRYGSGRRSKQARLAVTDAAAVDQRRRLVLIRRDEVEHLIMIGGPTDIVVESDIRRHEPARSTPTAPVRIPAPAPAPSTTPTPAPVAATPAPPPQPAAPAIAPATPAVATAPSAPAKPASPPTPVEVKTPDPAPTPRVETKSKSIEDDMSSLLDEISAPKT